MRYLYQIFQQGFQKELVSRLFQVIGACSTLILFSCGGTNSTPVITEGVVVQRFVDQNDVFLDKSYDLVPLDGYQKIGVQAYWPSNSEIPVALKSSLQELLPQINNLFIQQNFAFNQTFAADDFPRYKKIFFTPIFSTNTNPTAINTSDLQVIYSDNGSLKVEVDIDKFLSISSFSSQLIQLIYQSERYKYQPDNSLLSRLVSRGLALHFLKDNLPEKEFTTSVVIDIADLRFALSQVEAEINEDALIENWFMNKPINEQFTANAVGYYLAEQHFSNFSGSNASNSFSVSSELFLPWLMGEHNSEQKVRQYVRTHDVPDQIEVRELERQASLHIGKYFLEGLNHEKLIALSFDDGPSLYTALILDVLEQAEVSASFFWQGQNLTQYQEVIKRSIKAGHTIANHSWNHRNGLEYSEDDLWQKQVAKTNDKFQQLFNITPRFYRPPYGEISDAQVEHLASKGMKVLLWSVDSRDWNPALNSVEEIERELINNQHEEVISLMHDAGGNRQNTVDSLPAIIEHYKGQGYRFVNLETLLGISDKH